MKTIKRVTIPNKSDFFELPGSKFAKPIVCDDTTCAMQCTCQFAPSGLQFVNAMNYYCDHKSIWN